MRIMENGIVRDMTSEEAARRERLRTEAHEAEPNPEERVAELEARNQTLTAFLAEMERIYDGDAETEETT